jgi:hypothetical protein
MTLVEIVEHDDIVTGCEEFCGADASNITGAAGNKDFQSEPPWQERIVHSIAQAAHNRDYVQRAPFVLCYQAGTTLLRSGTALWP